MEKSRKKKAWKEHSINQSVEQLVNRARHAHKGGEAGEKVPCVHPAPAQPYQSRAPRHRQQSQQLWEAQGSGARLSPTRRPRREPWDQGQFQQALPPSQIRTDGPQAPAGGDGEAEALGSLMLLNFRALLPGSPLIPLRT